MATGFADHAPDELAPPWTRTCSRRRRAAKGGWGESRTMDSASVAKSHQSAGAVVPRAFEREALITARLSIRRSCRSRGGRGPTARPFTRCVSCEGRRSEGDRRARHAREASRVTLPQVAAVEALGYASRCGHRDLKPGISSWVIQRDRRDRLGAREGMSADGWRAQGRRRAGRRHARISFDGNTARDSVALTDESASPPICTRSARSSTTSSSVTHRIGIRASTPRTVSSTPRATIYRLRSRSSCRALRPISARSSSGRWRASRTIAIAPAKRWPRSCAGSRPVN